MQVTAEQIDDCPYCHTRLEIVYVKFGLSSVATVSTCPNCAVVAADPLHGAKLADQFSAKEPTGSVDSITTSLRARYRYSLAFLLGAVITAAFLRHTIHMNAGIAPQDIRGGALAAAIVLVLIFLGKKRRP
jgi:hypothetical protein